ncbi:MAG: elongation factor G [Actinomycetia bacterium]|nr:elongation factor G [Actinomycetes bacterium]
MPAADPTAIRNVALVGHRGAGKTALTEALLFESGVTNRLGTIDAGSTVSDGDEDEHSRQMSLTASICHLSWQGAKLNLIDTPGDAGFIADSLAALRVVDAALVLLNGVAGVEVHTGRHWRRCADLGLPRLICISMLDRERADFDAAVSAAREQLSPACVPITIPIGQEADLGGVIDLLRQQAYAAPDGEREGDPTELGADDADRVAAAREQLVEAIVETDEELMERYLEGEEIGEDELLAALRGAVGAGEIFPVVCGAATQNIGTRAVLDLIAAASPSPADRPPAVETDGPAAFIFKTVADAFAGRISVFRVFAGELAGDTTLINGRSGAKERLGQLLVLQGRDPEQVDALGQGDIGAVSKLKDTTTGDLLLAPGETASVEPIAFPEPVMSFAVVPRSKGDEEKVTGSLRRLAEEDPTLVIRRDEQTGEQLLAGMSQVHVEVAVGRLKRRFGVEVDLHQPRVPYLETIRKEARARARYKKQTGGRGQFGDCEIVIEPRDGFEGYEFLDEIVGGVIPQGFRPAVDKGIQEAMRSGGLAGSPVKGVRVRLVDGQHHSVDSSEMAFKIAGSLAWKDAYAKANPALLEPIMWLAVTVPDDAVGGVNGDLNSRRGRLLGMEPAGGTTSIQAEVPLAELLTYSQSLTSLTGGRGDYTMTFLRYEEVPAHEAQKVIAQSRQEEQGE